MSKHQLLITGLDSTFDMKSTNEFKGKLDWHTMIEHYILTAYKLKRQERVQQALSYHPEYIIHVQY